MSPVCAICGGTDRDHQAKGMCAACYGIAYRATEVGARVRQEAHRRHALPANNDHVGVAPVARRTCGEPLNGEKYRLYGRRFREARFGILCQIPLGYEGLVLEVFGRTCAACGRRGGDENQGDMGELVLDHHQPLCQGHPLLHNAVPLCRGCNSRKNDTPPEEFYEFWKLMEIEVLLRDTRALFETRFRAEDVR